jgi:hypothetical protein
LEGIEAVDPDVSKDSVVLKPVLIAKYYSGNQTEKNEMGGAGSTYGGKWRCIQDFGGET